MDGFVMLNRRISESELLLTQTERRHDGDLSPGGLFCWMLDRIVWDRCKVWMCTFGVCAFWSEQHTVWDFRDTQSADVSCCDLFGAGTDFLNWLKWMWMKETSNYLYGWLCSVTLWMKSNMSGSVIGWKMKITDIQSSGRIKRNIFCNVNGLRWL